ncbi:chromophore lyase CpcT/CpeT [Flavobacterium sedimenticola]|uniref:Chromophore lyase CpcT/CpeT n=1 Tax=Flavobacterium sedimenticola TaxID=3043286 RepID=A0ABT6XTU2_9FLAO|nr:chromophore lyase CpcT/CpeT [Flavobacterium sedimenticola]MDI9258519.1 chromophore lyase CpcT/CpeT [Flavobacterium sedimenticola]
MRIFLFSLLAVVCFSSCKSGQTAASQDSSPLDELVSIMQGHYSSEKQSVTDKDYFNISLRMTPIWKSKGHYLFVEQALFDKQDKPYRVRIYKVSQRGDSFVSEIYTLKDEKAWIGKWATPEVYDQLTEADIELKQGCEVVLKRVGKNRFEGATGDKTCPSELRGASWANSKVTVTENSILSWDQGFDKDGKQVWGATKGGYAFFKI